MPDRAQAALVPKAEYRVGRRGLEKEFHAQVFPGGGVGDEKQSIFSFQGAAPLAERLGRAGAPETGGQGRAEGQERSRS